MSLRVRRYWLAVKESGRHTHIHTLSRLYPQGYLLDLHNTDRPNLISVSIDRPDKPARLIV